MMAGISKKKPTIVANLVANIVGVIRTNLLRCSIAAVTLTPAAAGAQIACGDHADIAKQLAEKYQEVRRFTGIGGGYAFELWASDQIQGWTLLRVSPQGLACVMVTGNGWAAIAPPLPGDPASYQSPRGGDVPPAPARVNRHALGVLPGKRIALGHGGHFACLASPRARGLGAAGQRDERCPAGFLGRAR